jgi:cell wall assembly regulator SMI1
MNQLTHANPPAPAKRITELEERLGMPLPDDYRTFLAEQDGGYVNADNALAVRAILDVASTDGVDSVWSNIDSYADASLNEGETWSGEVVAIRPLLPVANDRYGNDFCLSLRDGSVWFIDHEREDQKGVIEPIEVSRSADSWSDFLASL